jgi:hypothetical protein
MKTAEEAILISALDNDRPEVWRRVRSLLHGERRKLEAACVMIQGALTGLKNKKHNDTHGELSQPSKPRELCLDLPNQEAIRLMYDALQSVSERDGVNHFLGSDDPDTLNKVREAIESADELIFRNQL